MFDSILKLLTLTYLVQASTIFGAEQCRANQVLQKEATWNYREYGITGYLDTAKAIHKIHPYLGFCDAYHNYPLAQVDDILRARIKKSSAKLSQDQKLWDAIDALNKDHTLAFLSRDIENQSLLCPDIKTHPDWQKATNFFKLIRNAKRATPEEESKGDN